MGMVIGANNGKQFEKPDSGMFHGVLADIVDLGIVKTIYKGVEKEQPMVRFIWILNVNGKDGKPLSVVQRFNANLHEKSNLYKAVKQILNAAPPVPFDVENLIGQTRQLFITRNKSEDGSKDYANVMGILPAQPGVVVQIPSDFVRAKIKKAQQPTAPAQQAGTISGGPVQSAPSASPQGADVKF